MTDAEIMQHIRGGKPFPTKKDPKINLLDEPDPPEPAKIATVNSAFNARVRAAVIMLLAGETPRVIREQHGMFVLRAAEHEIETRQERKGK